MNENEYYRSKAKQNLSRPDNQDYEYCKCNSKPCSCPIYRNQAQALTTGPFRIPLVSNDNRVSALVIGLKNHTDKTKTVRVTVDRCPETIFPDTTQETTSFSQRVTLEPYECTQIQLLAGANPPFFVTGDLVRVSFVGDICKEAIAIEATVVGLDSAGGQEPTMFFRHDDLVKTCVEHFDSI